MRLYFKSTARTFENSECFTVFQSLVAWGRGPTENYLSDTPSAVTDRAFSIHVVAFFHEC